MAEPPTPTRNQIPNGNNRLKHACDAGFLSGGFSDDDDQVRDLDDSTCTDSDSNDSIGDPTHLTDLPATLRVLSKSLVSMELVEMEMIKAREVSRYEAEKRRVESETELTQMLLQTQLQVASFAAAGQQKVNRKRKRDGEDESASASSGSASIRERALILGLLRCNSLL